MTETPLPVELRPGDARDGRASASRPAPGQHTTAHPHHDPETRRARQLRRQVRAAHDLPRLRAAATRERQRAIAELGRSRARLHAQLRDDRALRRPGRVPARRQPARARARAARPFIENYRWEPERGTRVPRHRPRDAASCAAPCEAEPFFCFHHVNAFEDGGELVVDLVAYDDADDRRRALPRPPARRRTPMPERRSCAATAIAVDGGEVAARTLADRASSCRASTTAGTTAGPTATSTASRQRARLVSTSSSKVDVDERRAGRWSSAGCYPGEPVFVRRARRRPPRTTACCSPSCSTPRARRRSCSSSTPQTSSERRPRRGRRTTSRSASTGSSCGSPQ